MATANYVPGVCNINPTEVAYRRKAGWAGAAISIIVLALLLALHAPAWSRLLVALPVFLATLGFLQARNRFCVAYAGSSQQNAGGQGMDGAKQVSAAEHAKDRLKANKLYIQAAAISVAVALALLFIP